MSLNIEEEILLQDNLIKKLAHKYKHLCSYEDLIQAGFLGLMKASKNYKENESVKFSTYAFNYIKGEMLLMVNSDRNIKLKSDDVKLYKGILKAYEYLTQHLNKTPTLTEVSEFMNVDEIVLEKIINVTTMTKDSLDLENESEASFMLDNLDDKIQLEKAIEDLPQPEKDIIKLRYLKDYTQSEVASMLNMSQVSVSRKEISAKEKVRVRVS